MFLVFAILAKGIWKGTFGACHVSDQWDAEQIKTFLYLGKERTIKDWLDCTGGAHGVWSSAGINFDNTGSAILGLAQIASCADWLVSVLCRALPLLRHF